MRHFLVVDDDYTIAEVMQMALESDGMCRVTTATSVDAALVVMVRNRPDAAVIDAIMPQVPGLALARAAIHCGVPVLLVSGEPVLQGVLLEVGLPLLLKPFRMSQLAEQMRILLDDPTRHIANLAASLDHLLNTRRELAYIAQESRRLVQQLCHVAEEHRPNPAA